MHACGMICHLPSVLSPESFSYLAGITKLYHPSLKLGGFLCHLLSSPHVQLNTRSHLFCLQNYSLTQLLIAFPTNAPVQITKTSLCT